MGGCPLKTTKKKRKSGMLKDPVGIQQAQTRITQYTEF